MIFRIFWNKFIVISIRKKDVYYSYRFGMLILLNVVQISMFDYFEGLSLSGIDI